METFIYGLKRAITSTISGLIIALITREVILEVSNSEVLAIVVSLCIFTLSFYILLGKMKYWGILYIIGWFGGLALMYYCLSSVISVYEIGLYITVTIVILYIKVKNRWR